MCAAALTRRAVLLAGLMMPFLARRKATASVTSSALWSQLYGPNPSAEMLVIDQPVTLDIDATVQGCEIVTGGELIFDPAASRTLKSDAHAVCVMGGILRMAPASASVVHKLMFINVNEAGFTAGGLGDHETDPGLCVMDSGGTLDLRGAQKTAWCRANGALTAGQKTFTVADATGWRAGDELVISPTQAGSVAGQSLHYDRIKIQSVTGNSVTLVTGLVWPHPVNTDPKTGTVLTAEVVNLTRNVVISGDTIAGTLGATRTTGRAHIMHMPTTGPVNLTWSYVEIVHMGPRKVIPGKTITDLVLGRYALHFHMMGDATRGTLVEGVAAHDLGSRAFVPHASHGMTFRDCVSFSAFDSGYWWDTDTAADDTDDLIYDHCMSGYVRDDGGTSGVAMSGFMLPAGGDQAGTGRPQIHGCVAFGVQGRDNASGFHWPSQTNSAKNNIWDFHDNDSHNNLIAGTFVWHNDDRLHNVLRLRSYNHGKYGVMHGAYTNAYTYEDLHAWGSVTADVQHKAQSALFPPGGSRPGPPITFTGGKATVVEIGEHKLVGKQPVLYINCVITSLKVMELSGSAAGAFDFVECGLDPSKVTVTTMVPASVVRVQTGTQAWRITSTGVTSIPLFA